MNCVGCDSLVIAIKALEYYANPKSKNNLEVGERSEFGCMCCTGTEREDGLDFDRSVVGLTAREALAAIRARAKEQHEQVRADALEVLERAWKSLDKK